LDGNQLKSLSNVIIEVRASKSKQKKSSLSLSLSNADLLGSNANLALKSARDQSKEYDNGDREDESGEREGEGKSGDTSLSDAKFNAAKRADDSHVMGNVVGQILVIMEVCLRDEYVEDHIPQHHNHSAFVIIDNVFPFPFFFNRSISASSRDMM
jgi:hypothetical protein